MSQGMGSLNAENAAENGRVLVEMVAPRAASATAPNGRGWVIMPTIVARKMARSCQAVREMPAGDGRNQRLTAVRIVATRGLSAVPWYGSC